MKLNEIEDPAKEFLEKNDIMNYMINPDGTIDVHEDVCIDTKQNKLPVKFGKVTGEFYSSFSQLASLEGGPSYVIKTFYCDYNHLTSLEWAPSYVGGDFYCDHNRLTSFHNVHKHVKEIYGKFYAYDNDINDSVLGLLLIKGVREIILENTKVQDILMKYLSRGRAGVIDAQQDLLDAGLDKYAKL